MNLIDIAKKSKCLRRTYSWLREGYYSFLTIISPELNTRAWYRHVFGKRINLTNPSTFNEKLLWLKLNDYINNPLVIQCADKYWVREYVTKCGYSELLNEIYGVYSSVDDIEWDKFPDKFVLKWNFGAGMNVICLDKTKLNLDETTRKLKKWQKKKCWLLTSEMQYKYAQKRIICEKYLADGSNSLPDYKVYCFHGEPMAIFVMHDRGKGLKTEFFDVNWQPLENSKKYKTTADETQKPSCLNKMLDASRAFSKPFPFVRCDFFVVGEKLYFGELTFTPAGGLYTSETKIDGKPMTEFLNIETGNIHK